MLDRAALTRLSSNSNTFTVLGDAGDAVSFGLGWLEGRSEVIDGTPIEIGTWVWQALGRRHVGHKYALVICGRSSAEMLYANGEKCRRIRKDEPDRIAGYYVASVRRVGITPQDIADDIKSVLEARK